MSARWPVGSTGFQLQLNKSTRDPERQLYNDVITSVAKNNVLALKDVLEKGLKERGMGGRQAFKRILNSLDFAPPPVVRGVGGPRDIDVSLPLVLSCFLSHSDCTKLLLEHGADPNKADENGAFLLALAVASPLYSSSSLRERYGIVALLLVHGADVKKSGPQGGTALHAAALGNRLEIVKMLVDKDADVNAQDKMGVTPLGIAKSKGFHECVKILEGRKNARPSAQESAGRSDLREQCLSDLTSMSVKELKAMLRMNNLECPSGLEKHELADYFLEQIMEKTLAKVCGTDDGDVIVTARPSSSSASSAAARPGPSSAASTANELRISSSSAAARPGPSPSSTSAHAAKGTARTSSSSAAAQPLSPSASPAAARPGRSTSSTSAKQANDTSRSSSSSAAAQPGPCSAVNAAFQKIEDSKGGPDEVQHPSNAAAQPPGPRPAVKACLWCGATEKRLKRCGGCETAWLCGKDCQQQAWPSHRAACKEAQRRA